MDVMDGTEKSGKINPLFLRTTIRGVTRKKKEKQREMNECSGNDCVSGKSSRDKINKKKEKKERVRWMRAERLDRGGVVIYWNQGS